MKISFSSVASSLGNYFTGFFQGLIGSAEEKSLEGALVAFVKTDLGKLALDAVEYASTLPDGKSPVELRDAAKLRLVADAKAAGKDLTVLAESALNLFIEMAYNYVSGTLAKVAEGAVVAAVA